VIKKGEWELHDADRVLVDEAHLQISDTVQQILTWHLSRGAAYIGLTATPIGLWHLYDHLITAGTTSEMRNCGALVPCFHYGPDEPDLRKLKLRLGQDLTEQQQRKVMMNSTIFGRVLEWFKKLNPEGRPTILFAPGVGESIWFAEQFFSAGISAAHIDGQEVWVNGKIERTSREARAEVLQNTRDGRIKVLCNRFVLREGIDAPWLSHGILATVFGSLQSYLQSGGRMLRAYPGLDRVTLQDHGGNWWRHGSLNADRQWRIEYDAYAVSRVREDRMRLKTEKEPVRCPDCALILVCGRC
jgi:superfamily II DNA or RNA helicase